MADRNSPIFGTLNIEHIVPKHVGPHNAAARTVSWNTLEELSIYAVAQGCTPAQFTYSVEMAGNRPADVVKFLRKRGFIPSPVLTANEE